MLMKALDIVTYRNCNDLNISHILEFYAFHDNRRYILHTKTGSNVTWDVLLKLIQICLSDKEFSSFPKPDVNFN